MVFYDALLPHVAKPAEVHRVSASGYALGYLGGGVLLAVQLVWILAPQRFGLRDAAAGSRLAFLSVAIWWVAFSIPLFRRVPEPPRHLRPGEAGDAPLVRASFARLGRTSRELRAYKQALLLLVAFLVYNDGIGTIIRMAAAYGAEIGIGQGAVIGAFLIVQFVGVPFTFVFGAFAGRIGAKRAIGVALAVYAVVSVIGYFMKTATHFFALAALVGMVQGGSQALSRSLFARMIPAHRSSEFFAFFAVFEKFAGIFGPAIFAAAIALTGSSRNAILSVIAFFVVGGLLLALVDVDEGERIAREAEAREGEAGSVAET
jgi:UMF1 family MFS transporter